MVENTIVTLVSSTLLYSKPAGKVVVKFCAISYQICTFIVTRLYKEIFLALGLTCHSITSNNLNIISFSLPYYPLTPAKQADIL